jgi:hypothetical protein
MSQKISTYIIISVSLAGLLMQMGEFKIEVYFKTPPNTCWESFGISAFHIQNPQVLIIF